MMAMMTQVEVDMMLRLLAGPPPGGAGALAYLGARVCARGWKLRTARFTGRFRDRRAPSRRAFTKLEWRIRFCGEIRNGSEMVRRTKPICAVESMTPLHAPAGGRPEREIERPRGTGQDRARLEVYELFWRA